jgi:23S rRNA (cytidine1920-2'-O)/16S rRNA (cytidine1409-2'-O)-methyltransferase
MPASHSAEPPDGAYASRGGEKLAHALQAFGIDPAGLACIDFGSHVGGFVDCLLRHGAARVHAVDPGFGILDPRLRADPRVVVHERCNLLRFRGPERCDLATVDVGWTPLRLALPTVARHLKPGGAAIVLVKPHYEAEKRLLRRGVLPPEHLAATLALVRADAVELAWRIDAETDSPLIGHGGNREILWLLRPRSEGSADVPV